MVPEQPAINFRTGQVSTMNTRTSRCGAGPTLPDHSPFGNVVDIFLVAVSGADSIDSFIQRAAITRRKIVIKFLFVVIAHIVLDIT